VISVLHVITDLEIGGAEMMLAKLVRRMDPSRYKNHVVSLTGRGPLAESLDSIGVPVHSLGMTRSRPDFLALPKLVRLLKAIHPSILQTWLYHADLLGTAAAVVGGRPCLVWNLRCSDMDLSHYPLMTRLTLPALSLCSRMPQSIIVNSHVGQRFHQRLGYRARRWDIIPNGFDLGEFRPDQDAYVRLRDAFGLPHDTIMIGMVARLDPMKDHATFLSAAHKVAAADGNVAFLLAGKGVESLASQVEKLGLMRQVHLLGFRGDVARLLPALDLFSLTSAFGEGFPNVIGEAMACGVPCVVTDVGDAAFLVGDAGKVVPPGNPELLAQAWLELIRMDHEKRVRLGVAARERIRMHFDLTSVVTRYERCYEEIAAEKSAGR